MQENNFKKKSTEPTTENNGQFDVVTDV